MDSRRNSLWTETFVVRWGEMDALGHVNNAVYFRYLEQARISWLDSLGAMESMPGEGPVLAHVSCDFRKAIRYPETIDVLLFLEKVGRTSITLQCELRSRAMPDTCHATARVVIVWVDLAKGVSVALPDVLSRLSA